MNILQVYYFDSVGGATGWYYFCFPGAGDIYLNTFQFLRFLVRGWNGDEFAQHLMRWFRG